jgi:GNAT superfamily N-acetyltransferase
VSTDPLYYDVVDATWPAASVTRLGAVTLREGLGGGSRVSAASAAGPLEDAELQTAEEAMRAMGQTPLFMIRDGQDGLDAQLEARGYQVKDPVNLWTCPVGALTEVKIPRVTTFAMWEPLAICREIWEAGGIGASRQAIMARAGGRKTAILARNDDKPAGAAFAAIHQGVAMVHAVEILPFQRRKGMGAWIMRQAAFWAAENGAGVLAVLCTRENDAANGLYASLGMKIAGGYHYRILPQGV